MPMDPNVPVHLAESSAALLEPGSMHEKGRLS